MGAPVEADLAEAALEAEADSGEAVPGEDNINPCPMVFGHDYHSVPVKEFCDSASLSRAVEGISPHKPYEYQKRKLIYAVYGRPARKGLCRAD
jgi:hypothetical protein